MSKSIKFKNDIYLDSSSVVFGKTSLDKVLTYSEDEQIIGKWIDGKKIYRKVFTTTLPICVTTGSLSSKTINISNLNVRQLISTNVIVNGEAFQSNLPLYTGNDPYAGVRVFLIDPNTININNANVNYNNFETYIILEYTKTTD